MDYLKRIEKELDLPPVKKEQVLRELRSHFEEIREELAASGMEDRQIEQEAERRLGQPDDIAARLQVAHMQAGWKSAILAALPFVIMAAIGLIQVIPNVVHTLLLASFGCVMLVFCIREIRRDRRPIWLATWIAACISIAIYLTHGIVINQIYNIKSGIPLDQIYVESGQNIRELAGAGIWSLAAVLAFWNSPRWRFTMVLLICVSIASTVFPIFLHPALGMTITVFGISSILLKALVSLKIFAWHRYGSYSHASLFLFGLTHFAITFPHRKFYFAPDIWFIPFIVILFARSSTWKGKFISLAAGIVLSTIYVYSSRFPINILDTLCNIAIEIPMVGLIILWPMLYDYWRRRRMPEFIG